MRPRIAILAALFLAACGGESTPDSAARTGEIDIGNASVEEVARQANAAAAKMRFEPGQWRTTVEVIEADVPGIPAAMAEQMRQQMLSKTTTSSCMTPEQAERPTGDLFAGQQGNCRFDRFTMKDGRIDAAMTCGGDGREAQPARIAMTGNFDATHFTLENRIEADGAPGGKMRMRSRVTGERTGACV